MQNLRSLLRNASSAANLADMDGGMLEQHLHSFAALSRSASFGQANSTLGGSQHRSTGAVVGAPPLSALLWPISSARARRAAAAAARPAAAAPMPPAAVVCRATAD
jgi:hypothetical protein